VKLKAHKIKEINSVNISSFITTQVATKTQRIDMGFTPLFEKNNPQIFVPLCPFDFAHGREPVEGLSG